MPASFPEPDILRRTARLLALIATACAVGQHLVVAIAEAGGGAASGSALGWAGAHAVAALVSVVLGAQVLDRCYPKVRCDRLHGNPAAALQSAAHALAAAAVSSAVWGGTDAASLGVSALFWGIGLATILLVGAAHRRITDYRDHDEIAAGNVAVAVSAAGIHLAIAIVVSRAMSGPFLGWRPSLSAYGIALLWVLAFWPLRQWLLARIILRTRPALMDAAVAIDRRLDIAGAEALSYLAVALGATTWA